jgi:GTP cyclohydrolase I
VDILTIRDWLSTIGVSDARALAWFNSPESEERIAKAYRELLSGYSIDPSRILNTTHVLEEAYRGYVAIDTISFYSICAHHLLPFYGTVDITYVPDKRILGLGKFPRLVSALSRRFQIQELLVREIAEEIVSSGEALAARATADGRHLCMCSRGPNNQTVVTRTTFVAGDEHVLPLV